MFYCAHAVDLVPANLPKVRNLIWDASPKWYDLGLELGVREVTLRIIKKSCDGEVGSCFTEMLSTWLKMVDPRPSWEGLIEALEQPAVGYADLAETVRAKQGIPKPPKAKELVAGFGAQG